jgi:CBS domain-containing protein
MSSPVIALRPGDSVRRAIRVLYINNITAAPVLGDHGELAGISWGMPAMSDTAL